MGNRQRTGHSTRPRDNTKVSKAIAQDVHYEHPAAYFGPEEGWLFQTVDAVWASQSFSGLCTGTGSAS